MAQFLHRASTQERHGRARQIQHKYASVWRPLWTSSRHKNVVFGGGAFFLRACPIKGNISIRGERIYHVPGAKYYPPTVINIFKGERWFCTEAAAQAAGWRRSRR